MKECNSNRKKSLFSLFNASDIVQKYVSYSCFKIISIKYDLNKFSTKAVTLVQPQWFIKAGVESEK